MTNKLAGKVAVVTGGSSGIGLGIAKRFVQEGARVFITGRRQSELDKGVTAIGSNATAVQGDTSNLDDLDRIYAMIKAKAGHIDVLAVNAGYYEFGSFGEITAEHFDKTFNTNVRGLLFTVQKVLPLLAERASVILTGSIASIKGFPSFSVYNASKAAVRSFARSWIADLKGSGIRINVLSPGHVETPGLSNLMTAEQKAEAVALVPLGRIGTPDRLLPLRLRLLQPHRMGCQRLHRDPHSPHQGRTGPVARGGRSRPERVLGRECEAGRAGHRRRALQAHRR